jgi:hypothetical protein
LKTLDSRLEIAPGISQEFERAPDPSAEWRHHRLFSPAFARKLLISPPMPGKELKLSEGF